METSPHLKFPVKKLGAADLSHFEAKRAIKLGSAKVHLMTSFAGKIMTFDMFRSVSMSHTHDGSGWCWYIADMTGVY